MRIDFQPLKANTDDDVGMLLFNRFVDNVARALKSIQDAVGAPDGLATLDADGELAEAATVTPATLHITATAVANSPVAVTLPAVGGKRHAIVALQLVRAATAAVAGGALLVTTSVNLPGNPAWTAGNAIAAGQTIIDLDYQPANPLRAVAPGTPTIITMPAAGANCVNRINCTYLLVD